MKTILTLIVIIICFSCNSPKKTNDLSNTIPVKIDKKYQLAKDSLNRVIERDKNNFEAYIHKAKIDFNLKNYSSALLTLKKLEKVNDKYFYCYYNQAIIYFFDYKLEKAIEYFKKALDIKKHCTASNLLKECYGLMGEYNKSNAYTSLCSNEEEELLFKEEFYNSLSFNLTTEVTYGPPLPRTVPRHKIIFNLKKDSTFKGFVYILGMPKNWTNLEFKNYTKRMNGKIIKNHGLKNGKNHSEFEFSLNKKDFKKDSTIILNCFDAHIEIKDKHSKRDTVISMVQEVLIIK